MRTDTVLNLAGAALPIALALVTVPLYIEAIGLSRYGVMAVLWVIAGYVTVFEGGLGRATANRMASRHGTSEASSQDIATTAFATSAALAALAGLLVAGLGTVAANGLTNGSDLQDEITSAMPWLGVCVAMTILGLSAIGCLEGLELFGRLNVFLAASQSSLLLGPLLAALTVGPELSTLMAFAAVGSVLVTVSMVLAAQRAAGGVGRAHWSIARRMLTYGGWVTLSSAVTPLLTAADRLLIAGVLGARGVGAYSLPYSIVVRVSILPASIVRTLFPRMSRMDSASARALALKAAGQMSSMLTPVIIVAAAIFATFLNMWVGSDLAREVGGVGEILLAGVWANAFGYLGLALLQAQGSPRIPAVIQACEVPLYLGALALALHFGGIRGAAVAWSARVTVDTVLLLGASGVSPRDIARLLRPGLLVVGAVLASVLLADTPVAVGSICVSLAVASVAFGDPFLRRQIAPTLRRLVGWAASVRYAGSGFR